MVEDAQFLAFGQWPSTHRLQECAHMVVSVFCLPTSSVFQVFCQLKQDGERVMRVGGLAVHSKRTSNSMVATLCGKCRNDDISSLSFPGRFNADVDDVKLNRSSRRSCKSLSTSWLLSSADRSSKMRMSIDFAQETKMELISQGAEAVRFQPTYSTR